MNDETIQRQKLCEQLHDLAATVNNFHVLLPDLTQNSRALIQTRAYQEMLSELVSAEALLTSINEEETA